MKLRRQVRELAQSQTRLQRWDRHLNLVLANMQRMFARGQGLERRLAPGSPGGRRWGGRICFPGDRRQTFAAGASCGIGARSPSDPPKSGASVYPFNHQRNYPVPSLALF